MGKVFLDHGSCVNFTYSGNQKRCQVMEIFVENSCWFMRAYDLDIEDYRVYILSYIENIERF